MNSGLVAGEEVANTSLLNATTGEYFTLKGKAHGLHITDKAFAELMDEEDELRHWRKSFHYPKIGELPEEIINSDLVGCQDECVYLTNHGIGLQPLGTKECLNRELEKWAKMGNYGLTTGVTKWQRCDEHLRNATAMLVGAKPGEVGLMNGLTVNEHILLVSFYQPTPKKYKILLEDHAFPSDHYAVESQIRLRGYDPGDSMVFVKPRKGEHTIRTEDIVRRIDEEGDSIAVVLLPGVHYYTGQMFEMEKITKSAQSKGCFVGFDLAHAVGNVELNLHEWGVDFACWCSYKYLNAGSGGIAGLFVHEKHNETISPKLLGWWGHRIETRFEMTNVFEPCEGASAYRICTAPILLCACLEASLKIFSEVPMSALRKKSKLLTGYLEQLLLHYFSKSEVEIITPSDPEQRGGQLSLALPTALVDQVLRELTRHGVVVDKRQPNIVRASPVPLYNSFLDIYRFVTLLNQAFKKLTA